MVPPFGQFRPGMGERGEQRLVQAFVAQLAVEALDERILGRLARSRVMSFHTLLLRPAQDRHAGQLGALVADDHERLAAPAGDGGQFARHPGT